jgi:hypothetical protein
MTSPADPADEVHAAVLGALTQGLMEAKRWASLSEREKITARIIVAARAAIRAEAAEEVRQLLRAAPDAATALLDLGGWQVHARRRDPRPWRPRRPSQPTSEGV